MTYIIPECTVKKTPDDGQRNCPKHVEFHAKTKFVKLVHLVRFTTNKSEIAIYGRLGQHNLCFLGGFVTCLLRCLVPYSGSQYWQPCYIMANLPFQGDMHHINSGTRGTSVK
jgi:hypothetical protein